MNLTFDEATHVYQIDGRTVPSVTQVIWAIFPSWRVSQWHLDRGTATHKACELYDLGTLDLTTVDPEVEPRLEAWIKFRKQYPCRILGIERMLGDAHWQYAGKIDRVLGVDDWTVVADLKNSLSPQVFLQLGAYFRLLRVNKECGGNKTKGMAVELRDDGQYRCQCLTPGDLHRMESTFLSALNCYRFMMDNGMLPERSSNACAVTQEVAEDHHSVW